MEIKEAEIEDWKELRTFYNKIYRENHPLQNKDFWIWQYGDKSFGRAFVCQNEKKEIMGHVGANFAGDIAWIINVFLDESCRGQGLLREMYNLARKYYPLAATSANKAGLGLYRNMRWIRYHDLVRYVKINPSIKNPTANQVCRPVKIRSQVNSYKSTHYFQQPFTNGIKLDNTTLIIQENVGACRIVDLGDIESVEKDIWDLGAFWIDYVTSWNDLDIKRLEKYGWVPDYKSVVPWRLDPIQEGSFCNVSFLSEKPLDNSLVVHRSFSDHGRIGSIK